MSLGGGEQEMGGRGGRLFQYPTMLQVVGQAGCVCVYVCGVGFRLPEAAGHHSSGGIN